MYVGSSIAYCDGIRYIQKNIKEYEITAMISVPALYENMYKRLIRSIDKKGKLQDVEKITKLTSMLSKVGIDFRRKMFKEIHEGLGGHLRILVNGAYVSALYVRANLIFIFIVINMNIKSYAKLGLGLQDDKELLLYFIPATAFGPSIGGFAGGIIASFLGGYQHKNSAWYVLVTSTLTLISLIPVALCKSIFLLGISLFIFNFFVIYIN